MSQLEPGLYVHYLKFLVECLRRGGVEFQSFFEQIMEKADPTFIKVKPSGRQGDWKNDGYSESSKTVYQVYAPEGLTVADAVSKIDEDFEGAKVHWGDKMEGWTFVWSSVKALPPQVVNALLTIKNDNPDLAINDFGHEGLWAVVEGLTEQDRVELLGPVPFGDPSTVGTVVQVTAAEVQALLNYLVEQAAPGLVDDDLSLVDLGEKIERNSFSDPVRRVIDGGLPLLATVGYYVNEHPDPKFSLRVSAILMDAYADLKDEFDGAPDAIFFGLVDRVAPGTSPGQREYWAAVSIIDYYFELCDIFER